MVESAGLEVRGLCKSYGGLQALADLSFSVQPGECVALIGPNGAGKSTTFACIAGQQTPSGGHVVWNGRSLAGLSPLHRLRQGMARTFQVAQTFESLTLLQNVLLLLPGANVLNPLQVLGLNAFSRATELLVRVGLQEQSDQTAGSLPYGAKKRLELAMALAGLEGRGEQPALLLLDEPAAGLAAAERAALMQLVHGLTRARAGQGRLAVLYTEHNMDAVFGFADRVLVLMQGKLAAMGTAQEVAANALVRSQYLGRSFALNSKAPHA